MLSDCSIMPPHSCRGNLQVCLIVGCREDEGDRQNLLQLSKEKLPILYKLLQYLFGQIWQRSTLLVLLYDDLRDEKSTVLGAVMTGRLIQAILWNLCDRCADRGMRWSFKGGDINTGFMGKLIGSREKWPFIEVTAKRRWLFRQVWLYSHLPPRNRLTYDLSIKISIVIYSGNMTYPSWFLLHSIVPDIVRWKVLFMEFFLSNFLNSLFSSNLGP